ncbi:MAG: linear amide C-N hydrolase [Candidatus Aminicenantes bacterium]|nr:MAG: linear amide C-N hydrolase [Candidatus Aminicenantes bacterium]
MIKKYLLVKFSKPAVILAVMCAVLLLFSTNGFPCQTFLLKKGNTLIAGHNLGMPMHIPGVIVINKRGVFKKGKSWNEILSGKPASTPPLTWVSQYGSITFNPFCRDFPDGGMNEAGLYIEEMTLQGTRFPVDNSKPLIFMVHWMQYVLDNFETVDQVIKSTSEIMLDGWDWHFFTADRQGNAAVIEFLEGKPVIYKGKDLPITVLCNTKYKEEMKTLKAFEGFGGKKPISLKDQKTPRFVHAAYMLKNFNQSKDSAIDYGFKILDQMNRGGTQWSFLCDLKNLKAYIKTAKSKNVRYVDLKSFDLSCKTPVKMLDIHANLSGNIEKQFQDYTLELNRNFINQAFEAVNDRDFINFVQSRGSTVEQVKERIAGYSKTTTCKN